MQTVVFFGSFQHYSTKVLQALVKAKNVDLLAVVTTPPRPAGRKKLLTKTPTQLWAEEHGIPVFAPEKLSEKVSPFSIERTNLTRPDFFVVAGYGKKLPPGWLKAPKIAPLNLHFSLLPKYRGANPAEWAILLGEKKTGVTLIKMAEGIDTGPIIAQEKLPIEQPTFQGDTLKGGDSRETLYDKLYTLAAHLIIKFLASSNVSRKPFPERNSLDVLGKPQPKRSPTPSARRLTRPDGFIPWPLIHKALKGEKINPAELPPLLKQVYQQSHSSSYQLLAISSLRETSAERTRSVEISYLFDRAIRALSGFPGAWTTIKTTKGEKRLKLLSAHLVRDQLILDSVQLEGKKPNRFNAIKNQLNVSGSVDK